MFLPVTHTHMPIPDEIKQIPIKKIYVKDEICIFKLGLLEFGTHMRRQSSVLCLSKDGLRRLERPSVVLRKVLVLVCRVVRQSVKPNWVYCFNRLRVKQGSEIIALPWVCADLDTLDEPTVS